MDDQATLPAGAYKVRTFPESGSDAAHGLLDRLRDECWDAFLIHGGDTFYVYINPPK